jgi:hypothetical protein
MKTPNLEFQISQLRLDKIIYAVEAGAFNLAAIVGVNLVMYLRLARVYVLIIALSALAFTLFMAIGNLQRLRKIKELEKNL